MPNTIFAMNRSLLRRQVAVADNTAVAEKAEAGPAPRAAFTALLLHTTCRQATTRAVAVSWRGPEMAPSGNASLSRG
jgi:hypothetical protein